MRAAQRKNRTTAAICAGVVVGMVGLSYASVPLYRLFCQVTGLGGTTKVQTAKTERKISDELVAVRFDANVNAGMPWKFKPGQHDLQVRPGEETLAFYRATNHSDRPITGTATFNVTPYKAGPYFVKVDCFCFKEQTLAPGEIVDMPVSFYVDPEMLTDVNTKEVRTITLSYTFYEVAGGTAAKKVSVLGGQSTKFVN